MVIRLIHLKNLIKSVHVHGVSREDEMILAGIL